MPTIRVSYGSTLVLVKKVGAVIHVLDLFAEGRGMTLTNAIERLQADVLKQLGLVAESPVHFIWVLYHTDCYMSRYRSGRFIPLDDQSPDPEFQAEMHRLYGEGGIR